MRNALFADLHNPRLADLVGSAIESEPVAAHIDQPHRDRKGEVDSFVIDPIESLLDDHIRVGHINRLRRRR